MLTKRLVLWLLIVALLLIACNPTATTSTIYIGQLDLDMYDSAKKELVWRGVAKKTLSEQKDPEKRQKNIAKGIAKLLKNYPPPQKKK